MEEGKKDQAPGQPAATRGGEDSAKGMEAASSSKAHHETPEKAEDVSASSSSSSSIAFKSRKKKNKKADRHKMKHRRQRQTTGEAALEDDDSVMDKLESAREDLKAKARGAGVSTEVLLKKVVKATEEEELIEEYGLLKGKDASEMDEEEFGTKIQTAFAEETGRQERDKAMLSFVSRKLQEEEGRQRKGKELSDYEKLQQQLWEVPENLKTEKKVQTTKGILSQQLMRTVPAVKTNEIARAEDVYAAEHPHKRRKELKKPIPKSHLFNSIVKDLEQDPSLLNYSRARFDNRTAINSMFHNPAARQKSSEEVFQMYKNRKYK